MNNSGDDLKFWCSESLSLIHKNKCMYIKGGLIIIRLNMPKKTNLYNFLTNDTLYFIPYS